MVWLPFKIAHGCDASSIRNEGAGDPVPGPRHPPVRQHPPAAGGGAGFSSRRARPLAVAGSVRPALDPVGAAPSQKNRQTATLGFFSGIISLHRCFARSIAIPPSVPSVFAKATTRQAGTSDSARVCPEVWPVLG